MNVREIAYWANDFFKKSPVRNKYKKLKNYKDNADYLTDILRYARETVPYYKTVSDDCLSSFPVVDKTVIKKSYDDFRSIQYLDDSKLIVLHTSGSSGTPFKAYQDQEKDNFHKAALILQNEGIGWEIGDRWAHMRNWGYGKKATRFECLLKNMLPLSVLDLNDEKLEHIVRTLISDTKLQIVLGYASGLERLVQYIVKHGYQNCNYGLKLIIADSDNLSLNTWSQLEDIFKCPVLNRYGSIENGIIAITKPYGRAFHVDTSQFFVEILKMDEDVSVEEGEIGRVVITDLHNKALPFIRYYNGDLAIAQKIVNGQCLEIGSLQGREISALRKTDGTLLSETNIMGHFKEFTEIGRYQIIQKTSNEYLMKLESDDYSVDTRCIDELKMIFGSDSIITIEHVDLICSEKNGKYRVTISKV